MLISSNLLYYNSEIWHLSTLLYLKNNIRSASANGFQICTPNFNYMMSYDHLHSVNNRAQPHQILKYKFTLLLFKLYRVKIPTRDWLALNHGQSFTSHRTKCILTTITNYKVGKNIPIRRSTVINHQPNAMVELCPDNGSLIRPRNDVIITTDTHVGQRITIHRINIGWNDFQNFTRAFVVPYIYFYKSKLFISFKHIFMTN
jgi:hypothetical protein